MSRCCYECANYAPNYHECSILESIVDPEDTCSNFIEDDDVDEPELSPSEQAWIDNKMFGGIDI